MNVIKLGRLYIKIDISPQGKPAVYVSSNAGRDWAFIDFRALLEIVKCHYQIQDLLYPQNRGKLGRWYYACALLELARTMNVNHVMSVYMRQGKHRFEEVEEI